MKKLVIALALLVGATSVYASCFGPICWDDQGIYLNTTTFIAGDIGLPSYTKAQLVLKTPRAAGMFVRCSDCVKNVATGVSNSNVCLSTGTGTGAYSLMFASSTICG